VLTKVSAFFCAWFGFVFYTNWFQPLHRNFSHFVVLILRSIFSLIIRNIIRVDSTVESIIKNNNNVIINGLLLFGEKIILFYHQYWLPSMI